MPDAGGETSRPSWPRYVAAWAKADVAIPSEDRRSIYTATVLQNTLHIASYDGLRPNTVQDSNGTDISGLAAPPPPKKKKADLPLSFGRALAPRPLALVLASIEASEVLLVLLSFGQLLMVNVQHLGMESILGVFPEVSDDHGAGSALCFIHELGWAVVAAGSKLGLAEIYPPAADSSIGSSPKAFDLPKGMSASMVMTYPEERSLILVGTSTGHMLLYTGAAASKGQARRLNLVLVQMLDIAGSVSPNGPPSTLRSRVGSFVRGQSFASPRSGRGEGGISDVFASAAGEAGADGMLVAAGGLGSGPGSILGIWTAIDGLKETLSTTTRSRSPARSPSAAMFQHSASAKCLTKILRLVFIPASRAGGSCSIIVSLDGFGDITLWMARSDQLMPACIIPGRCSFEVASARSFAIAGSLYLLVGTGSRSTAEIGWLDLAALLELAASSGADLVLPYAGHTRCCSHSAGGDTYFVSGTSLRYYKVSTGRTASIAVTTGSEDSQPLAVLDERSSGNASYLLLLVREASLNVVWLIKAEGDLLARIPDAVHACFSGARVAWLSRKDSKTWFCCAEVASARAGACLNALSSVEADGVERLLGCPGSDTLLYWGSRLLGGPLQLANASSGSGPAGPAGPALPTSGPSQLVDHRWDGPFKPSGSFLALAAPFTIWIVRLRLLAGDPCLDLQRWLDLRAAVSEQGRVLSLAWLRAPDTNSAGAILISTPFIVCSCCATAASPVRVVASFDRPQLLASSLPDRLLSVELQTGTSLFAGLSPGGTGFAGKSQPAARLRARIRTRPVNVCEVLGTLLRDGSWMNEVDWRLAPAELPQFPDDCKQLWPAAVCTEAPPQLRDAAGAVLRLAASAHDEFRALAAILCGLSSRRGGSGDAAPARVAAQIEDTLHRLWSTPSRSPMVATASSCLVVCSAQQGTAKAESLALAGSGLVKHSILPLGILVLAAVRSTMAAARSFSASAILSPEMLWPTAVQALAAEFHWSDTFQGRAPLAEALVEKAAIHPSPQSKGLARDLPASAILEQPFGDVPPLRKPPQACPLHTATILQWLGLGSTQVQVRSFKAIQQEAEESPSSEESPRRGDREPVMLSNGLLVYWRCADGEGSSLRDSAGCGRPGALPRGGSWLGPLSPDDPMEPTDEWGQVLLPNFAVQLSKAELSYTASSISDRQQLDLVGGARGQQVPSSRNVQASVLETPDPSACEAFERGQLREKKLLQIRVPDLAGNC
eukprot:s2936_g3.t1